MSNEKGKKYITPKAIKAGGWYIVADFLNKGAVFLTTPFFTRMMSTYEYGEFSTFISWLSIITVISTWNLHSSVSRAKFEFKDEMPSYNASILILGTVVTGVCYLCFNLFKPMIIGFLGFPEKYIQLMFVYICVFPALCILQMYYRVTFRYKLTTVLTIFSSFSALILSMILVSLMQDKLFGRIFGYMVAPVCVNVVIYIYILYKGRGLKNILKYWKYSIAISLPLVFHTLSGNILGSFDRIMITNMIGANQNALYSVAYSCGSIMLILSASMNSAWCPWLFEKLNIQNYSIITKMSKYYLLFFVSVAISLCLIAPELLLILGGEKYIEAAHVLPPIIVGCIFQFVYSFYANIEVFEKRTKGIAIGTIIAASVNVALNLLFIPLFGYEAAAYTTLIGYLCLFVIHYIIVRKIGYKFIYDIKFILKILAFSCGLMFIILFMYDSNVRYVMLIVLILIFYFVFRKIRRE